MSSAETSPSQSLPFWLYHFVFDNSTTLKFLNITLNFLVSLPRSQLETMLSVSYCTFYPDLDPRLFASQVKTIDDCSYSVQKRASNDPANVHELLSQIEKLMYRHAYSLDRYTYNLSFSVAISLYWYVKARHFKKTRR